MHLCPDFWNECLHESLFWANFAFVIEFARHIEILLLDNDCVIIPGLGGFVAHHISARYDEDDGLFLPPYRTLGFNPQLTLNDSLLAQSYADAYDISFPEALDRIEQQVEELTHILNERGSYELEGLGRLTKDIHGRLTFKPYEGGILTPGYYGLGSFDMAKLQLAAAPLAQGESEEQQEEPAHKGGLYIEVDKHTGKKRVSISLNALRNTAVAAVLVTFIMLITSPQGRIENPTADTNVKSGIFYNVIDSHSDQPNVTDCTATPLYPTRAKAKVETRKPVKNELKRVASQPTYSIVLCSHVPMAGARYFMAQAAKSGVTDTRIYSEGSHLKVLYGHYASADEAQKALEAMHGNSFFRQAWVLAVND